MKDRVLITGGFGYVGGRIAEYLSRDNDLHLSIGTRRDEIVVPDWLKNNDVVQMDLASKKSLEDACSGVRYVIHLAGLNEIDSLNDPEKALLINGGGTLRLLRTAQNAGVERFIYFSTAHVYGAPLEGIITEETVPKPVHPYAITHRVAEDFVLATHKNEDLIGIVFRLSNSFGSPNSPYADRWTLIVNDLCRQAVRSGRLILRSTGLQKRDFITLEDVGKAVLHFLGLKRSECGDGLFNLGGDSSMRIVDLAQLVSLRCMDVIGFSPGILCPKPVKGEVSNDLTYNIEKAKATGFVLSGDINKEIDSMLSFCNRTFGCSE